ncbi:MAG: hypothetical protein HKN31_12795, partial [Pricia sp.]|nr:hypothetical protein [Pricia sp.]
MKTKVFFIAIFFVLLSACEKDDAIENPANTLEAKAAISNDAQLFTNELVMLNGSLSKDKGGKPFQYLWSFKNKPGNSASELENEATVNPKFMPDKAGIYLVQLKIYNQSFFDTDEISLSVKEKDGPPPVQETVVIDADIEEDTHLINIFEDDTKIDYLVTDDVSVKALLTIDPSVTIGFEAGMGMFVDSPGAIVAVGSPEGQILFTGKNKTPGYWKGLIISSNNTSNVLERTTVEYGGGYNARGIDVPANIALDNASFSHLTMRNSITRHSAGYGLVIEPGTFWNAPLGNKIAHNQKPLLIAASQLGSINGLQEFDKNITNVIEVIGNRVNAPETSFWINPQDASGQNSNHLPYLIIGKIE